VIARIWSARATRDRAPDYAEHLRAQVLPALRAVEGYAGARLLRREVQAGTGEVGATGAGPDDGEEAAAPDDGGEVELVVVTYWRSPEAIRDFAGADPERAVVAPEAEALLTRFDRRVRHYEVVVEDGVNAP
jgi:heme-degrading monooxygenase HmoA